MGKIIGAFFLMLSCIVWVHAQAPSGNRSSQGNQRKNTSDNTADAPVAKGKLIDQKSQKPLEYATISLLSDSSKFITGTITDADGTFLFAGIKPGTYRIKAAMVGYETYTSDPITIPENVMFTKIGRILLKESSQVLEDVEVKGEKEEVQMQLDKKVFNVDKNTFAVGGTATEVLQQIPSISTDMDGNIQMRGSGNLIVWINGKPSGITGASRQAVLDQLPAASIEKVEIITNPSAKFDPEGMGGIINIILKKNISNGYNASIGLSAANRDKFDSDVTRSYDRLTKASPDIDKWNPTASFNIKYGKFNFSNNVSYRQWHRWQFNRSDRRNDFNGDVSEVNQLGPEENQNNNFNYNTNLDFQLNDKNLISLGGLYNVGNENKIEIIDYKFLNSNGIDGRSVANRRMDRVGISQNADLNTFYKRTFDQPGRELSLSASLSQRKNLDTSDFAQNKALTVAELVAAEKSRTRMVNDETFVIGIGQLDYIHPVTKYFKIESGAKATYRQLDAILDFYNFTNGSYTQNFQLSNKLDFSEQIQATYVVSQYNYKTYGFMGGLRVENTLIEVKNITGNARQEYLNFFPSVHALKKLEYDQEIKVSYSRRINRPDGRQLNPFPSYTDTFNLVVGTPLLRPEYTDSYELTYSKLWKDHSIIPTIYYRNTQGAIWRTRYVEPSSRVSITEYSNFGTREQIGFEFIVKNTFFKLWNITSTLNVFYNENTGQYRGESFDNSNIASNARMMHTVRLPKNFMIQATGFYMSPITFPQGTFQGFNGLDLGLRKDVWSRKGTFTLTLNDVFNTRRVYVKVDAASNFGFSGIIDRKFETRYILASFAYKFGQDIKPRQVKKAEFQQGGGMDAGF